MVVLVIPSINLAVKDDSITHAQIRRYGTLGATLHDCAEEIPRTGDLISLCRDKGGNDRKVLETGLPGVARRFSSRSRDIFGCRRLCARGQAGREAGW